MIEVVLAVAIGGGLLLAVIIGAIESWEDYVPPSERFPDDLRTW